MSFIDLLLNNKLDEAKQFLFNQLNEIVFKRLDEAKQYIASTLDEDANIQKMGRITRIRRRIRRDSSGKIIVQKNATRSAMKGYRISGKSIKRISAVQRQRQSMNLKRSWRTSRRSHLSRTLLKRKMSMRRRYALGLR